MELHDLSLELYEAVAGLALEPLQGSHCLGEPLRDMPLKTRLDCTDLSEGGLCLFGQLLVLVGEASHGVLEVGLVEFLADRPELLGAVCAEAVEFGCDCRCLGLGLNQAPQGPDFFQEAVNV